METQRSFSGKKTFLRSKPKDQRNDKFKNFIGSKAEGQGFADKRKKKIQYEYLKLLKKEKLKQGEHSSSTTSTSKQSTSLHKRVFPHSANQDVKDRKPRYEGATSTDLVPKFNRGERDFKGKGKFRKDQSHDTQGPNAYTKVVDEQRKRKDLKLLKKQEAIDRKEARDTAMNSYQKKKKDNFKKICKKTHKGQPVMKNQIEYLLQKIEKQVNQT